MTKKSSLSVNGIEIPVYFHNYKLLKDKSFVFNGSYIYFIQGPNEVGKTSFLNALTSLQIAKDDTGEKVSRGESEGYYEATIPAASGEMVTIRHEFTDNNKGKFIAIMEDGAKISNVTDIRNLFKYTPITVHEFFAMSNTAEGRRKQRDIILNLLEDEKKEKFDELDSLEAGYYQQRTEENRDLQMIISTMNDLSVTDEDMNLVTKKKEAQELLDYYKSADGAKQRLDEYSYNINNLNLRVERLKREITDTEVEITQQTKLYADLFKTHAKVTELDWDTLNARITKGEDLINRIARTEQTLALRITKEKSFNTLDKRYKELQELIDKTRTEKNSIVANSELPVENISFEDGYLTIDGFQFKENQVCESDGVLILANILAKINPSPIQVIGDAGVLDANKLEKLNKIAEENNKVMFVDEVIRTSNELVVVGYEDLVNDQLKTAFDAIKTKTENPLTPDESFKKKSKPSKKTEKKQPMDDSNQEPMSNINDENPLF